MVTQEDWDNLNRKVIKAFCSTEEKLKAHVKDIKGLEHSLKFAIKLEEYEACKLIIKEIERRKFENDND